jgi:hypothetical protein
MNVTRGTKDSCSILSSVPYDVLETIRYLMNDPVAIAMLKDTSKDFRKTVKSLELYTSMNFAINSNIFKKKYFEKLSELGVDLNNRGSENALAKLRKEVQTFLTHNLHKLNITIMHDVYVRTGQSPPFIQDIVSFDDRIAIYNRLIILYLKICNFPNTHNDIYYLMKLYNEKATLCSEERTDERIRTLHTNSLVISFELMKMYVYLHLTRSDLVLPHFNDVLKIIVNYYKYILTEGIDGFIEKDDCTLLCLQYIEFALISPVYSHDLEKKYWWLKNTYGRIYPDMKMDAIISLPYTKYTSALESNPKYQANKTLNILKSYKYIITKSKTKIQSVPATFGFV